jgi:hypothetical protein
MLVSLKEFSYGLARLNEVAKGAPAGTAIIRFYMNSLYQYASNYFLVGGGNKLAHALQQLGSADLLEPIDRVLAMPLGDTTFGEIVRTFRDKFLTHSTFTFAPFEDRVLPKFDFNDSVNADRFNDLLEELYDAIENLYVQLAARFSEAFRGD